MTPAQQQALAVALDGLREQGVDPADVVRALYDEATAGRMLRAAKPFDLEELADLSEAAFLHWRDVATTNNEPTWPQVVAMTMARAFGPHVMDSEIRARFVETLGPFSPPETRAGASTPQPPGETA